MKSGIINVYKEKGFTSFDVVAKLRGILRTKKIGHTGTLDPDAEGVLPVCIGRATRVCELLTDKDKVYEAVLLLGTQTDTQDTSGTVLKTAPVESSADEVREAVLSFVGDYSQVPPMYSALKVQGKKLYELAREGKTVERKPRNVQIFSIDILDIDLPRVRMSVHCSKGTYIRTLCHDIGQKLGCGGCMEKLLRTKVAQFELSESLKLDEISDLAAEGRVEEKILSVDDLFCEYPAVWIKEQFDIVVHNGNRIRNGMLAAELPENTERLRVYDSAGAFIGIYGYKAETGDWKPVKMFMKVISDTLDFWIPEESAVTLGKFDGIHRGHQKLMKKVLAKKADGLSSVVFTFGQMPGTVFLGSKGRTILTRKERREHLESMGVDYMVECPFVVQIIQMEAERFIEEILVNQLHARYIAVGTDFHFGHNRRGDYRLLQKLSYKYGYEVELVDKECLENEEISSSRVRKELEQGHMKMVRELLGYPYYVSGKVVYGHQIGRTLGIPTLNLIPDEEKMLPPNGVYLTKTLFDGKEYFGITNIGVKPTISGEEAKGIETHLFDFEGDLYGRELLVEFYQFERGEQKFSSLEELREQLEKDVLWGRKTTAKMC